MTKRHNTQRFLGVLLLLYGLLKLLQVTDIMSDAMSDFIFQWKNFLLALAVYSLVRSRYSGLGWILLIFTLTTYAYSYFDNYYEFIWPTFVILSGILLVLKNPSVLSFKNNSKNKKDIESINLRTFFSKSNYDLEDKAAHIGASSVFASQIINLSAWETSIEDEYNIDIDVLFAETTLILPKNANVNIKVSKVLGGVDDKLARFANKSESENTGGKFKISGECIFGSLKIIKL